jgi:hypothetical protein
VVDVRTYDADPAILDLPVAPIPVEE